MILDDTMGSTGIDCIEPFMAKAEFRGEPIFMGRNQLKNESSDVGIWREEQPFVHRISISDDLTELSSKVSDKESISSSPCRGLDHCFTAPAGTIGVERSSLLGSHPVSFSRCKTFKERLAPDLMLDKLSESEKENLAVNLVKIQKDGTVECESEKSTTVASNPLELQPIESAPVTIEDAPVELKKSIPRLSIAILVVGTRGDVQPFLAMAKRLQEFGHRVRLATHINFRDFVKSAGVEFYPLGGDSRVLASYMVKNKGLPSTPEDIFTQRKQLKAIIESVLPACTEPDIEAGVAFKAQAIIANPPAYGQAHVAEALGVPLHIFFTLPWTPTSEFPHPFIPVAQCTGNWLSYKVFDLFIWWGIRSYINDLRKRELKLPPIAYFSTYDGSTSHLRTGYMWSPHMVAKPKDWGPLVDIVGYCFLNLGSKYQPREELVQWIQKGPKPIYIGFGSMPLENPSETTRIIMDALKEREQRGILDRGWGELGILTEVPENIFLVENCPHDWLFPQCSAVVHHGGAGTTAVGLKAGCPTTIVPFVGDQFFWAERIYHKGLGPEPIPFHQLSVEALSNAIRFMLQPEVKSRAMEMAKLMEDEDGVGTAVDTFHQHLPLDLPLPDPPSSEDDGPGPDPLQLFFTKIGNLCCLACS